MREEREKNLPGEDLESSTVDLEQIELIHLEIYLLEHDTKIKGIQVRLWDLVAPLILILGYLQRN